MDWIIVVAQLALGWAIKKWPLLAAWPNRLIPVFNAVLAILIQFGQAATAHASNVGEPGSTHPGWFAVWKFLQPVLLNTLLSTGIFSSLKNIGQHVQGQTSAS